MARELPSPIDVLKMNRFDILLEAQALRDDLMTERGERRVDVEKIVTLTISGERSATSYASVKADLEEMRTEFAEVLKNTKHDKCEECEGSGGVENIVDVTGSRDWEPQEVVDGWTDPADEACTHCLGTGWVI